MPTIRGWLGVGALISGSAYLASNVWLLGWLFVFLALLYCVSGVGPLVDRWEALRMRKKG